MISTFNSLSLSPALSALLAATQSARTGPLQKFYDGFNRKFGRANEGYVGFCAY